MITIKSPEAVKMPKPKKRPKHKDLKIFDYGDVYGSEYRVKVWLVGGGWTTIGEFTSMGYARMFRDTVRAHYRAEAQKKAEESKSFKLRKAVARIAQMKKEAK
jgi:hypothetical protein